MNKSLLVFKHEAQAIKDHFPGLDYAENDATGPSLTGQLELMDEDGQLMDLYEVMIKPVGNYPYRFPFVYETGKRIPINVDWHMFADGHCCIAPFPEEVLCCKQGLTLKSFIETQVIPYFWNQKHREVHGYFLQERSHGHRGTMEFFEELLQTHHPVKMIEWLAFIRRRAEPYRTNDCFCGSGNKYRNCHRSTFRMLQVLTDAEFDYYHTVISQGRW